LKLEIGKKKEANWTRITLMQLIRQLGEKSIFFQNGLNYLGTAPSY